MAAGRRYRPGVTSAVGPERRRAGVGVVLGDAVPVGLPAAGLPVVAVGVGVVGVLAAGPGAATRDTAPAAAMAKATPR